MAFLKIGLWLVLLVWVGSVHAAELAGDAEQMQTRGSRSSGKISFDDMKALIEQGNLKMKSLDSVVKSEEQQTGYLKRSFIPDLEFSAGFEDFHSDRLGDESTVFYGVEAKANVFKGQSDSWQEKKRESMVQLAKADRTLGLNEMVFAAQKTYLELAEAKSVKRELAASIERLRSVSAKVNKKVQGGVISRSALTSLRLVQVDYEHEVRDLDGEISVKLAHLKTLLGASNIKIEEIDENVLVIGELPARTPSQESATALKYAAKVKAFEADSEILSGANLPAVDLFANYKRNPFSEREFVDGSDREEWSAGVKVSWRVGQIWENKQQQKGAALRAQAAEKLRQFYVGANKSRIEALEKKRQLLAESAQDLKKEIGLSQSYNSRISSEYLRGVKSTSDLASTFNQLLEIKRHHLRIVFQYQLATAEIKKIKGAN